MLAVCFKWNTKEVNEQLRFITRFLSGFEPFENEYNFLITHESKLDVRRESLDNIFDII